VQQQRLNTIAHLVALFLDDLRLRTQNASLAQGKPSSPPPPESPGALAEYEHDLEQLLAAVMSAEEEVANQNVDLGLLNSLSTKMIGALQTKQVLSTAIKQTGEAMQADAAWCYLQQDGALTLSGQHGLSDKYVENMAHLPPGTGAEGMAFTRQEPILRDALLFHSGKMRSLVQEEGLMAIAAVPLFAGGEPFGVLAVANRRNREWSERDRRMLVSIGQRVEQAIVNSQKFTAATEKASTLEHEYRTLQQDNIELTRKAAALEQQLQSLHQSEQQIWRALAASQHARRNSISLQEVDEELIQSLRQALVARQK
jgi:signal transduction protein with GAF and PtsI domain